MNKLYMANGDKYNMEKREAVRCDPGEAKPVKTTQIAEVYEKLAMLININAGLSHDLANRLEIILRPDDTKADNACSSCDGYSTQLAVALNNLANTLDANNHKLRNILDRCELPL